MGGVDFGEADRVVYLLTLGGRLSAFAHGAKKSKRRFQGALDPFTTITASLSYSRKKSGMPTLSNAQVQTARLPLRRDLKTIALASYVAEVTRKVAPEGQAADGLFDIATVVLDWLLEGVASIAARRAFEVALIDELGYRPMLSACTTCGDVPNPPYLDLNRGGVSCFEHRGRAREMGPKTMQWLEAMLDRTAFDPHRGFGADWADRAARKLTGPMAELMGELLDRPPNALALLEAESL